MSFSPSSFLEMGGRQAITSTYMRSKKSKCKKSYFSLHGYTHDNFKNGSDNLVLS